MPICLFCLTDVADLTDEHVFPAALGGELVVPAAVCARCNNGFSRDFEQPLAREMAPLRNLLVIPDRYGSPPEVAARAMIDGQELGARLLKDGTVQLTPVVTVQRGDDGRVAEIRYEHMTARQLEEKRREAAERGHKLIESESSTGLQADVTVEGNLHLVCGLEGLRLASKIAYTGLALRIGRDFATRNTSDDVRAFVMTGQGAPCASLFLNEEYLTNCAHGCHQHSLVVAGRRDKGQIAAIVRLFGALCYFVNLSTHYEGADFYNSLVYDAQRGQENAVLVSSLDSELLQIDHVTSSPKTFWDDPIACGTRLVTFIADEIKARLHAQGSIRSS